MFKIGFIGTGVMGSPMALHLSKKYEVGVYNRTIKKALKLKKHVKVYNNIKDLVQNSNLIITIVGYPSDVLDTYNEVFKYIKKDTICIEMTTSSPSLAKKLYLKAKENNAYMLDIPVTGGDKGAREQTLTLMAGGDEDIYNKVYELLTNFGTSITYMGKAGSGQYAKLSNQIAIASNICGLAESLSFAKSNNLNLNKVLNIITSGSASSFQANVFGNKMIDNDYAPGFYVKHLMKDLKLVLENNKNNLDLNITNLVLKTYEILGDSYLDKGTQSIFDYYIKQNI